MIESKYIKARNLQRLEMVKAVLCTNEAVCKYILQDVVPGKEYGIQEEEYLSLISDVYSIIEYLSNILARET